MQQSNHTFTDLGFKNVLTGARMFEALNINAEIMADPRNGSKIQEIADFLNEHPDPEFVLSRIRNNRSPHMDNLDFLVGYVQLSKKRMSMMAEVEKLNKELKFYE